MHDSQRRELNKGLGDGFTRAFELVLAPTVFAIIGFLLGNALGTLLGLSPWAKSR